MRIKVSIILIVCLFVSCSSRDERLEKIDEIISNNPQKGKVLLEEIDEDKLSRPDQNFYELLRIKALDKMYVRHTSDSLIVKVKEYFSKDKKGEEYIESLYYCGRVYYDLGDFPTAMKYFQEVIKKTEDTADRKKLRIRSNALSQLVSMMDYLQLDEEFLDYYKKLIAIDKFLKDNVYLIKDYIGIGSHFFRLEEYDKAEKFVLNAKELCPDSDINLKSISNVYLAAIKNKKGEKREAWEMLKSNMLTVDSAMKWIPLSYAADCAYGIEKYDSAYIFAKELISIDDFSNKKTGYEILLREGMEEFVSPDSARSYVISYSKLLSDELKRNEGQSEILQNTRYNYGVHEQARLKAEKERNEVIIGLCVASIAILILMLLYVGQRYHNKKKIIQLQEALILISRLEKKLKRGDNSDKEYTISGIESGDDKLLREELQKRVLELQNDAPEIYTVPIEITESRIYNKIKEAIKKGESLNMDSSFWEELEETVSKTSHNFMRNLNILLGGKMKEQDKHIALLVKCGVMPSQMSKLLNKEKGTISYRRTALGMRAFDRKLETKMVDKLIRLL